jgi:hypothetical protein
MFTVSLLFLIGLAAVLSLVFVIGLWDDRVARDRSLQLILAAAILGGYLAGGALAWSRVPAAWNLSFSETMAASVDAEKYGHPVEHFAESTMVLVLAGSTAAGAITAVLAAIALRFLRRPHPICPC